MTETEKITLNVSPVDLGHIDLLVEEGFYSNRSDFLRTAIRSLLSTHTMHVDNVVTRRSMVVGVLSYSARDLGHILEKGEQLDVNVVGVLHLGNDVPPDLALRVIRKIKYLGSFQAPDDVKSALAEAGRIA
jgi:Arc/MetJ-type ribon-helix-helix transcriptional regulator